MNPWRRYVEAAKTLSTTEQATVTAGSTLAGFAALRLVDTGSLLDLAVAVVVIVAVIWSWTVHKAKRKEQ